MKFCGKELMIFQSLFWVDKESWSLLEETTLVTSSEVSGHLSLPLLLLCESFPRSVLRLVAQGVHFKKLNPMTLFFYVQTLHLFIGMDFSWKGLPLVAWHQLPPTSYLRVHLAPVTGAFWFWNRPSSL